MLYQAPVGCVECGEILYSKKDAIFMLHCWDKQDIKKEVKTFLNWHWPIEAVMPAIINWLILRQNQPPQKCLQRRFLEAKYSFNTDPHLRTKELNPKKPLQQPLAKISKFEIDVFDTKNIFLSTKGEFEGARLILNFVSVSELNIAFR